MTTERSARLGWTALALVVAALTGAGAGYWYGASAKRSTGWAAPGHVGQAVDDLAGAPTGETSLRTRPTHDGREASDEPARASREMERMLRDAPGTLDVTRVGELIDRAARLPGAHERDRLLEASLERLAEVDPHAALARAQTLDPAAARKFVPAVLGAWAVSDLAAAAEAAFVLQPAALRMAAAREILRRRGDLSPNEQRMIAAQLGEPETTEWLLLEASTRPGANAARPALAEAAGMAGQARRHERLDRIARLIALQSPTAALALADDLKDPRDRAAFQSSVAGLWAESDPVAAAQWLENQSGGFRWPIVNAVVASFARSDPQAALDWARRVDPQGTGGAWSAAIATIAETDPVTAVEHALAADIGRGPRNATTIAMAFLARKDPLLASTYLERVTAGRERSQATAQIALEMARQGDPSRALEWLASREDPGAIRQGRAQIAFSWAANDPDAALRFADRLPPQERREWQGAVVSALANFEPDRIAEMVRARRGDADYASLLATAARTIGGRQPEVAIALADELSDRGERDEVLATAIPQLAQRAPRDAIRMLDRIEDEARRGAATQAVAQIWAQHDVDGAFDWVRSMPSGQERDHSIAILVPSLPSARAMESAIARIQEPALRSQAVFNAAMTLAQKGQAEQARSLVFRHPLDPGMMQAFETRLRDGATDTR